MICSRFMCVNEATDFCNGRCARCYAELRLHGTPVVETVAKTVWDGANGMFDDGPITEEFKVKEPGSMRPGEWAFYSNERERRLLMEKIEDFMRFGE